MSFLCSRVSEHDITTRKYVEVTCLHIALASTHCLWGHGKVELFAQLNSVGWIGVVAEQ